MELVEITQDGAAVLKRSDPEQPTVGLVTQDVASCAVMAFQCENATVLVHDTGQTRISDIVTLVRENGDVVEFSAMQGMAPFNGHAKRLAELTAALDIAEKNIDTCLFIPAMVGYVDGHGFKSYENVRPQALEGIPNREKRNAINELNNLFSGTNSQSLPLDVQYREGSYTDSPPLSYTVEKMLAIASEEPKFFLMNMAYLGRAHDLEVVSLPEKIYELFLNSGISVFADRLPDQTERDMESRLYREFLDFLKPTNK